MFEEEEEEAQVEEAELENDGSEDILEGTDEGADYSDANASSEQVKKKMTF